MPDMHTPAAVDLGGRLCPLFHEWTALQGVLDDARHVDRVWLFKA